MLTRRAVLWLVVVALGLGGTTAHVPAQTAPPPTETITLDEARAVARQALFAGRFELAREIAMGLLQADPEDAYAYGVLAAAHSRLNDPRLARAAARLSYKYSTTPQDKFGAARTAASISYQQERPTVSQAWLRVAATHADTPSQDKLLAQDYRKVRAANPFSFNINLSVAPSNNVNNGTDNVLEVNNGIPTQGIFRNSSRALSGTVGTLDVRLQYRLRATDQSRTTATGRIYTRRVELSDSAEALAPSLSDGDFASTYVETGLNHQFALGKPGNSVTVSGALGASWYGGERNYDFAKIGLARSVRLSPNSQFSLRGGAEQRQSTVSDLRDSHVYTLGAQYSQKLDSGARVNLGLTLQDVNGDFVNADFQTASLRASYTFGKQIGPAQITAGVTLGYTDYDQYRLVSPVAGGRQDTSVYGDVSLFFADYDFAGFAPTIRLRSGQRSSNVNRFDISETTISLGIQSKF
ncbi:surface lipoprotein assembly modifier [uncultured Tateyamaria sp.]|uniref:surface lipoprotein assembly modifier n=1 Tax=uncultured Tateyamaria sp. TaxID=455651 RepID=UPI00261BECF6|nr:surface lipoprotein assembly modifier [uncultured Tateyamaria sp.]